MKAKLRWATITLFAIVLVACNSEPTKEDILNEVEKSFSELDSYRLLFDETENTLKSEGEINVNIENKEYNVNINGSTEIYGNEDELLVRSNGVTEDVTSEREFFNTEKLLSLFNNPIKTLSKYDDDFIDHIEIDMEDENEITIEYVGDEDEEEVLEEYAKSYLELTLGSDSQWNIEQLDIDFFTLEIIIDKETALVNTLTFETAFSEQHQSKEMKQIYTYEKYNEMDDIDQLDGSFEDNGNIF